MKEQDPKTGKSPLRLLLQGGMFCAGWFVTFLSHRRAVRDEVAELRREISEQRRRLMELEKTLSRMSGTTATEKTSASPAAETGEKITPELLALIAAAVTAFLGKKVKIHQARLVNPEVVSPWAQQGRVFVQASHDLTRL